MIRKHFRIRRIVIGLAFAAIAAPAAQAAYYVDGPTPGIQSAALRSAATSHQPIASEISVQSTLTQAQVEALRYQAMVDFYTPQSPVRSENSFGVPGPSAGGAQGPSPVQTVSRAGSGFDWSDAGIGGSIVFGAALMLLTAVSLGRRHRSLASV